jgi:hypothetical protein
MMKWNVKMDSKSSGPQNAPPQKVSSERFLHVIEAIDVAIDTKNRDVGILASGDVKKNASINPPHLPYRLWTKLGIQTGTGPGNKPGVGNPFGNPLYLKLLAEAYSVKD